MLKSFVISLLKSFVMFLVKLMLKIRRPTFGQFKQNLFLPLEKEPSPQQYRSHLTYSFRAILNIEYEVLSKATEINDNERMIFFPSFEPHHTLTSKGLEMDMFDEGYTLFLNGVCVVWWFIRFHNDFWFIDAEVAGQRWVASHDCQQLTVTNKPLLHLGQEYKLIRVEV